MRSRDGFNIQRATAEALAENATYLLWEVECAKRFESAIEAAIAFADNPPEKDSAMVVTMIRVFLRDELRRAKAERPDYKVAIQRIRDAIQSAEDRRA